jgi:predicted deacylase
MRRSVSWAIGLGLALACVAFTSGGLAAERLSTYFVAPSSDQTMRELADRFEVLRRSAGGFELVVPESRVQELYSVYPEAQLKEFDMHASLKALPPNQDLYDVASMERRLRDFVARFPDKVKLETYGTSPGGRPEYYLTMAQDAANPDPAKPGLMITSATHGDEVVTVEVTLGLIEKLLTGYANDPRIQKMVDDHVIYWVPAVCVDGYATRSRYVQGRDPNRDFAWPENPNRQPATACTRDIVQFFEDRPNVVGTLDIHAAASMIMFPWAWTHSRIDAEDYRAQDDLTTRMAEHNRFAHGTIADTIYIAKGSSADYYYWKRKTVSVAVEVSHNFAPGESDLTDIITENTESTWRFIEHFAPSAN